MIPTGRGPSEHVVDALIARRLLTATVREDAIGVVAGVLHAPAQPYVTPEAPVRRGLPQLVEVVAYLGGALVLAAGGLFLVEAWEELGFGARVVLLGVVALVLLGSGVVASRASGASRASTHASGPHREVDDSRRRLAGTLVTGSALTTAFLVGMVVEEYLGFRSSGAWPVVAAGVLGLLVAAVGYRIAPTALGLLAMLSGVIAVVLGLLEEIDGAGFTVSALALFLIGAVWVVATELDGFREETVARAAAVGTAFYGAQMLVIEGNYGWLGYLLTVLVAVGGIGLYLRTLGWPYLAGAVLSVTVVVPEMVSDWTDGSVGVIGGVLVTGITLLLASFAGYRLRARTVD